MSKKRAVAYIRVSTEKDAQLHSYDFQVEGMHCENCAAKVARAINAIDGAAADVSLRKKHAHVDCDRDIAPATIIAAVAREGYAVKEISGEMK